MERKFSCGVKGQWILKYSVNYSLKSLDWLSKLLSYDKIHSRQCENYRTQKRKCEDLGKNTLMMLWLKDKKLIYKRRVWGWRWRWQIKSQIAKELRWLYLLHDTFWGGRGGASGWACLLVFLGLRLQPFPLFFLLLLAGGPGTGG